MCWRCDQKHVPRRKERIPPTCSQHIHIYKSHPHCHCCYSLSCVYFANVFWHFHTRTSSPAPATACVRANYHTTLYKIIFFKWLLIRKHNSLPHLPPIAVSVFLNPQSLLLPDWWRFFPPLSFSLFLHKWDTSSRCPELRGLAASVKSTSQQEPRCAVGAFPSFHSLIGKSVCSWLDSRMQWLNKHNLDNGGWK